MKFMRILAMLMAVMLCLAACSAKEEPKEAEPTAAPTAEAAAETADAEVPAPSSYESFMIKNLGMGYDDWMNEEMYASFAATFFLDIAFVDAFGITQISTDIGLPAVYVGELQGSNYGNGMNLTLFYTDETTSEVTMISATVYLATGLFEGYLSENVGDPAAMMDSFVADGTLQVYHEVPTEEFLATYGAINQIITEAASGTGASE